MPGLGAACSTAASTVTSLSSCVGSMKGMEGSTPRLRGKVLKDPVIGAAHAMVMHDNAPEDEGAIKSQLLR